MLTAGGETSGVLVAWSEHPGDFEEATTALLARFADQVALSIQAAEHMAQSVLALLPGMPPAPSDGP